VATEDDWASYATAVVDLSPPGRSPLRIHPADPGSVGTWPEGLVAPVSVVTAWNPDGVRLGTDDNEARHRDLVRDLADEGVTWWPATGRDVDSHHVEAGVAVPGLAVSDALALGRRHGQAAVYLWTPAAWCIIACDGSREVLLGWALGPAVDRPD